MRRRSSILLFLWVCILVFLPGCGILAENESAAESIGNPSATIASGTPLPDPVGSESEEDSNTTSMLDEVVVTRTPMPTPTPGVLAESAAQVTEQLGLDQQTFLGLGLDDWIILLISIGLFIGLYILTTWVVKRLLPNLARKTETIIDDRLLEIAGREIHWLVMILALRIFTPRLVFLSADFKSFLVDVFFVLAITLVLRITWHVIDFFEKEAHHRFTDIEREVEMAPVIRLAVLSAQSLAIIIFISILLSYFGVEVFGLVAALGVGGLALSLAARDTVADAIAGLIILIDRPFRVGDRIEIQSMDTWGDVTTIGLRSTSILTRDNRMVILPNSMISNNEIVNYSYPNPEYRIQTHISIAYGTPIKTIQELVLNTMKEVEGVMQDRDIDVLYHEMGNSAMIFRVRWWINTYANKRRVIDRVHIALQEAIDGAGLVSPFNTQTIDFQINPDTARLIKGLSTDVDRQNLND